GSMVMGACQLLTVLAGPYFFQRGGAPPPPLLRRDFARRNGSRLPLALRASRGGPWPVRASSSRLLPFDFGVTAGQRARALRADVVDQFARVFGPSLLVPVLVVHHDHWRAIAR